MPKNSQKSKSTATPAKNTGASIRAPKRRTRNKAAMLNRLTTAEQRYARLVADPCNGPLSAGIFGDGSGGIVSRFETDGIMGDSPGVTASALAFAPALAASWASGKALDTDGPVWNGVPGAQVPGANFLNSNASQFRCLAACLRIYWPGTELNRQGIVSNVQTSADVVNNANASVAALRAASTYVQRMPEDFTELKWLPSEYELDMRATGVNSGFQEFSRFSALVATTSGVPAATPIRWRMVAVYEWVPKVATGFASNNVAASVPVGSFQRVTQALTAVGNWMYASSHEAAAAVSAMLAGVGAARQLTSGLAAIAL